MRRAFCVALTLASLCANGWAQENGAPPVPSEVKDASFERYFDPAQLGVAWSRLDAATLTDIGLQLAEGERILLRSYAGLTSAQVLDMAGKVAVEKNDKVTVERLLKAADKRGDKAGADKLNMMIKLAGPNRAGEDEVYSASQLQKGSPAAFDNMTHQIIVAKLAGDKEALGDLKKGAEVLESLTADQRKKLEGKIDEAGKIVDEPNPAALALRKLSGASRQPPVTARTYATIDSGYIDDPDPYPAPPPPPYDPYRPYPPRPYPPYPRPPRPLPPPAPPQPVAQKAYSCGGMRYSSSFGGVYVQSHGQLGSIIFEPGDVIYSIGGVSLSGGQSVDSAVNNGYLNGNRVVRVRDVNSGQVVTLYY